MRKCPKAAQGSAPWGVRTRKKEGSLNKEHQEDIMAGVRVIGVLTEGRKNAAGSAQWSRSCPHPAVLSESIKGIQRRPLGMLISKPSH